MKSESDRNRIVGQIFFIVILLLAICGNGAAQTFTVLVNFDGTNGSQPTFGPLTLDSQGNLWGTTKLGGTNNLGTIFKMTAVGVLTTVYNCGKIAT